MKERVRGDLISMVDGAPLTPRYWVSLGLLSAGIALDFFDLYIAGFLVAVLGPQWHLTYGQSSVMLLNAGLGSIFGSLVWGVFSDAWGRKRLIVAGTFICAAGAGATAFVPDGTWWLFAVLRFVVGFGLGAATTPTNALIVEFTPTRYRTIISSLSIVFATVGTLLASGTAATLLALLGWRGVAALGMTPALVGVLVALIVPESVRWLTVKGRLPEARAAVARLLKLPLKMVPNPTTTPIASPSVRLRDLYGVPRRFWLVVITWLGTGTANFGIYLWGPTIVALLLGIQVKEAGRYFVYVALAGIAGKIMFSLLPQWLGRRRCGELAGYGIAVSLAAAGYFHSVFIGHFPLFIILLVVGALFFDGGFANLGPYSVEIFGVRMGARGAGLGQAAGGMGRILGPLCLAVIAGSGNLVTPQATSEAVFPAFLFLAGCGFAVGLTFTLIPIETHGKPLSLGDAEASTTDVSSAVF